MGGVISFPLSWDVAPFFVVLGVGVQQLPLDVSSGSCRTISEESI